MKDNSITCPKCQNKIDINDAMFRDIESKFEQNYSEKIKEIEEQKKQIQTQVEHQVEEKLKQEKQKQLMTLKQKLESEVEEQIAMMQKDLMDQARQLKEFHKQQAELARLKREKEQMEDRLKAESEIKLNERLKQERQILEKNLSTEHQFKIQELQKQLNDQKKLTEEMQRKHQQGSMQLQGEVQELAIEEWLKRQYPTDGIEEIKKGAKGGDCLQIINTPLFPQCGKIYYESKRTKSFQPIWIEKFKNDMQEKSADVGVIVTQNLPKDWDRLGQMNGVWICNFEEFKGLSQVLRQAVIDIQQSRKVQENKGDKMVMLYDYMTSNSFKMQIQAIVEGFSQLKEDLEKEKRAMQRIWKSRETQIEKVLTNTIEMYGSVKGLAGPTMGTIEALDFPEED